LIGIENVRNELQCIGRLELEGSVDTYALSLCEAIECGVALEGDDLICRVAITVDIAIDVVRPLRALTGPTAPASIRIAALHAAAVVREIHIREGDGKQCAHTIVIPRH
jgi:hypothetical protein